jgi:ABC-type branched-subunit amino acid transport system ATPase component
MSSRKVAEMGRGPHLPEPGAVQGHERARQHHDRTQPAHEVGHAGADDPARVRPSAKRSRTASRSSGSSISCEIQSYRKTPVGRLPYGLQKRVDLGRALAMEPSLLLLDEPMAGMNRRGEAGHEPLHP